MLFSKRPRTDEFEAAAMPHMSDIYRTATRLLGNGTGADDVVQDVYLQAWKSFDQFEIGTNCRAWLFRILFNVIRHHRRGWFSRRVLVDRDFFEDVLPGENPVPDTLTDEDILFALDRVPQSFREVLLLVDVQEFSYKEAAETLGIPIGTVMSRVSRGRDLLRNQLVKNNSSVVVQSTTVEATREAQRDSASPALLQS